MSGETLGYAAVADWIHRFATAMADHRVELVKLDTAIGDGDHGTNMDRGMKKAAEKLDTLEGDDVGAALKAVGMALISSVGGAAGPLYGTLFLEMGKPTAGLTEVDLAAWTAALDAGVAGVKSRGKAQLEDKTMLDALTPALEELRAAAGDGAGLADALARSAAAAQAGAEATIPLEARRGRASYLGPRSVGHQDPGATSSALLLQAAAEAAAG